MEIGMMTAECAQKKYWVAMELVHFISLPSNIETSHSTCKDAQRSKCTICTTPDPKEVNSGRDSLTDPKSHLLASCWRP